MLLKLFIIMPITMFEYFLCSTVVQRLKLIVSLGDYKYPRYLKDLARQRMEDSEHLAATARQKLPSVK